MIKSTWIDSPSLNLGLGLSQPDRDLITTLYDRQEI
jgi:hypothetical protein